MLKRSSTPLYEVMMKRGAAAQGDDQESPAPEAREPSPRPLAGRMIRMPAGYVLLAVGGGLGLLVLAYTVGWSQGKRVTMAELERFYAPGPPAEDPLAEVGQDAPPPGGDGRTPRSRAGPAPAANPARENTAPGVSDAAHWGPIESDPRRKGLHYFVIAQTRREGALRLARFCREHRLEAYVVTVHNSPFRRVIVRPGLASRAMSDPGARTLMEAIRQVGRSWKDLHPGESDLHDAYLFP